MAQRLEWDPDSYENQTIKLELSDAIPIGMSPLHHSWKQDIDLQLE